MARRQKYQKKHRIFVIEDDRITRKLITHCLDEAGYESVECPEGKDAIHAAEMWPPTAMVVDVMLPDCQGTEIVEEILEDPRCSDIKVVFLTGLLANKPANGHYSFDINGKRYPALRKPIDFKKLLDLLADCVAEAEREKQDRIKAEKAQQKDEVVSSDKETLETQSPDEPEIGDEGGDVFGSGDLEYQRGHSSPSSSLF